MEFTSDKAKFTIPDKITVRMQLEYIGAVTTADPSQNIIRKWDGAKTLIETWECEFVPDFESYDIDKETNTDATDIITWAAIQVWLHMSKLDQTPKN